MVQTTKVRYGVKPASRRIGLAQQDDLEHIVAVARKLHKERPGELDLPAWLIGQQWRRAGTPDCDECPVTGVCPKIVFQIR